MMGEQTTDDKTQFMSITQLATDMKKAGMPVFHYGSGTFWLGFNFGAMMRIPTFYLVPPTSDEVKQVLWHGPATVASYLLEPDEHHPANTWLYLCTDHDYSLDKLSGNMRREVSRGLKELRITFILPDQVLARGIQAFCETRRRLGLDDGTPEEFHRRFVVEARLPEFVYLGAWKDDLLAAFLSILQVDNWVEIIGCFSMDSLRQYRPNQTLFYSAFSHYLVERGCCLVSGGSSSIQADSNAGLHIFKKRVGYDARPVHRAFVLHPLLHPLANRLTHWGVNTALRLKPEDHHLKKARGILANVLGDVHG